jgi:transcription antitermination factor NusG
VTVRWFAVYTHPLREMSAGDELLADKHPMRDQIDVLVPFILHKLAGHRAPRGKTVKRALLPCYLLARFDPDAAPWRTINGTRGVVRLICHGDTPTPVNDADMTKLKTKVDAEGMAKPGAFPKYYEDQLLHVRGGVWAGRAGLFVEAENGVLTLSIDILGGFRKVSVPEEQVTT